MNGAGWEDAVLVACLLLPLAGIAPGLLLLGPDDVSRWSRLGRASAAAGGWLALLLAGAAPDVGRLAPDRLALAGPRAWPCWRRCCRPRRC